MIAIDGMKTYRLIGLTKIRAANPLTYTLLVKDPAVTKPGYLWHTEHRTEAETRGMLLNGGMAAEEVDRRIALAPFA